MKYELLPKAKLVQFIALSYHVGWPELYILCNNTEIKLIHKRRYDREIMGRKQKADT